MITNQQRAEELLEVLGNSQSHNPAWALKEVLEKLRNQLSGQNPVDLKDELNILYVLGYDDCLKDIDCIIDELEAL
jgi:uncharacterized protein YihD (DUF1040 family)